MKPLKSAEIALFILAGMPLTNAAVVTNPATIAGPSSNLIDPSGDESLNAEAAGSTSQSTIEARTDVRSLQTFSDFSGSVAGDVTLTNYVDFTNGTFPDISFTVAHSAGLVGGSGRSTASTINTSTAAGGAFSGRHTNAGSMTMTIVFGTYDAGVLTNNAGVDVAAFALTNLRANATATVRFFGTDGVTVLSTQTATGSDESSANGTEIYFGYDVAGEATYSTAIGSIVVTRVTSTDTAANVSTGLDDLVFSNAIIPEPSSLALAAVGLSVLGIRRRM